MTITNGLVSLESDASFASRVLARTGKVLADLPVREDMPPRGGHIFCARDGVYVVATDYPVGVDADGCEVYDEFCVVDPR